MSKCNIVHITGHLGGGVGTVVLSYLTQKIADPTQYHSVVSLDTISEHPKQVMTEHGVDFVHLDPRIDALEIHNRIRGADIVLLHWWNHPLIMYLLIANGIPFCRLIVWCHISGSPPPNCFTPTLFEVADRVVFTTPLSFLEPEYVGLPPHLKSKTDIIWSTGGVERVPVNKVRTKSEYDYHVGYVGNLDFTKIHPKFIKICEQVAVKNTFFTVIGPLNSELINEASNSKVASRVKFTGFVSEDTKWSLMSSFDVFGYPLAPHHYGTCDQALQEAMAMGIPPIVLNNPMESYMVQDNKTGLVCNTIQQYVDSLNQLGMDLNTRARISDAASMFARETYSLRMLVEKWNHMFYQTMLMKKSEKIWHSPHNKGMNQPYRIFLESLGRHAGPFMATLSDSESQREIGITQIRRMGVKKNWLSSSKSTVHQYSIFFPEDLILKQWSSIMREDD